MPRRMPSPYGAEIPEYPPHKVLGEFTVTGVPLVGKGSWLEQYTQDNPVQEEAAMPQKPDPVQAKNEDKPFPIHPEGQFAARCVDVIDLGESVSDYPGSPPYLAQKVALAFWTGECDPNPEVKQEPVNVVMEFTLSMGEKANLRKFLQQWRGKTYTDEEAKAGVPVDKLYGVAALVTVEQFTSKAGRKYARIASISPLPKQMASAIPPVEQIAYERDEWWGKKKEQYAKDAAEFRAKSRPTAAKKEADFSDFPDAQDVDEDSLPF